MKKIIEKSKTTIIYYKLESIEEIIKYIDFELWFKDGRRRIPYIIELLELLSTADVQHLLDKNYHSGCVEKFVRAECEIIFKFKTL